MIMEIVPRTGQLLSIVHYSSYIKDSLVKWTWSVWKAGPLNMEGVHVQRGSKCFCDIWTGGSEY